MPLHARALETGRLGMAVVGGRFVFSCLEATRQSSYEATAACESSGSQPRSGVGQPLCFACMSGAPTAAVNAVLAWEAARSRSELVVAVAVREMDDGQAYVHSSGRGKCLGASRGASAARYGLLGR